MSECSADEQVLLLGIVQEYLSQPASEEADSVLLTALDGFRAEEPPIEEPLGPLAPIPEECQLDDGLPEPDSTDPSGSWYA